MSESKIYERVQITVQTPDEIIRTSGGYDWGEWIDVTAMDAITNDRSYAL